ncbi:DUF4034 domain-containing protein [Streptomyces nymphaeiformis]|uniref:DUF4034 domain-containing protein n=1 Tax=Streptomyces nymphaeiformis TaxID=2663842 RepID=A0A7W7U1Q8_9ACTN|nr:DUF4034 domain-containing protein [Streptomyces nymphaeiformis]MBB4983399.1 hypothetical protein [Streptomyces nymphaeiformis]
MARLIPLTVLAVCLYFWFKSRRAAKAGGSGSSTAGSARNKNVEAAASLGLLPADRLDVEEINPPSPERAAATATVRSGDWAAGAAYVEEAGRDWYERDRRISLLAEAAVEDDAWLLAWRRERPEDPAAAAVHACSLVYLAWEIRGSKQARHTTQEQFASFHRVLEQAREAFARAQELAGDDPTPFIDELPLAMGLGYPHEAFERIWTEIEKRDPHHFSAYGSGLQYWCRKWCGSHEAALAFARRGAEKGRPGQLLTLFPLEAYFEQESYESDIEPQEFYNRPEVVAATDAALADVAAAEQVLDARDPRIVQTRHLLAWMLYWQDRYEEALAQFRLVDGHIGCRPWTYSGDPKARYTKVRDYTAAEVLKKRG